MRCVALMSASFGAVALAAPPLIRATIEESTALSPARRRRRKLVSAGRASVRRSRGLQARPKRKPNRLHISKRVRRKHRRAA
jgi:hypothetical protein